MTGGGGDAPQPPPAAASGGEFLLQLLQKPNQHHHRQQQTQTPPPLPPQHHHVTPSRASPPQSLTHDPAVAAVGPSLPFPPWPSSGHDLPPPPPWPHTLSPPYPPQFLGFPQNPPWSLPPGFPSNDGFNITHGPQLALNHRFIGDEDVRKLGFLGVNVRRNSAQSEHKLMFGSFPCEIRTQEGLLNGNSLLGADRDGLLAKFDVSKEGEMSLGNRSFNGSGRDRQFDSRVNSNSNASGHGSSGYRQPHSGFYRPGTMMEPRQPPPGFPSKPRGVGNWDTWSKRRGLEHNVDKEMNSSEELNHRDFTSNDGVEKGGRLPPEHTKMRGDALAELGLGGQLDRPGPPSGSNLHSVLASDVEESLMAFHEVGDKTVPHILDRMRRDDGVRGSRELDDVGERLRDSLGLDEGSDDKNESTQHHKFRDKDVRSDTRGQRLLSQRLRNFKRQMKCRIDIDRLNACFIAIYELLIPAEEEKAKQKQLLTLLEKLVSKEWPRARLYLYGSCANSFGVSKSDIDVCLAIEDADINKSEVLLKLADILQSDNLQNVQALTRARVPIVKLMDPATGISCDICINNVLAVVNTKLLRDYAQIDVRLRQLAFIVKHWAKSRGVNETYQGTLSSYAYVLMCIHFLQQRKPAILPCLQGMKTTYSVTVDDVECAYFDQVDKLRDFGSGNKESIAQLVWAFFNYWAYCHDYANSVISVRTGSVISKQAKDWTRRIGNDRHLICIEDPFEISHDLGRVVDKYSIKVLREEFERAANIMQYDPDPCATLFEPYLPS